MKTKGVIVLMGLLVLACWVLLAPNVSFASDRDNNSFWAPVTQAFFDKDKDWGRSDKTPNWFNLPSYVRTFGDSDRGRASDSDRDTDRDRHHHPSPCR